MDTRPLDPDVLQQQCSIETRIGIEHLSGRDPFDGVRRSLRHQRATSSCSVLEVGTTLRAATHFDVTSHVLQMHSPHAVDQQTQSQASYSMTAEKETRASTIWSSACTRCRMDQSRGSSGCVTLGKSARSLEQRTPVRAGPSYSKVLELVQASQLKAAWVDSRWKAYDESS